MTLISKKRFASVIVLGFLLFCSTGCSVFMAARQPGKKDLSLLKVGTSRSLLIVEFGALIVSETRNGKKYEIFKFTQGYPVPARVGRAVFHGAADVFSLCLWEVVGTPTEMVFNGRMMAYEISYDENNRVDSVTKLNKEVDKNKEEKDLKAKTEQKS